MVLAPLIFPYIHHFTEHLWYTEDLFLVLYCVCSYIQNMYLLLLNLCTAESIVWFSLWAKKLGSLLLWVYASVFFAQHNTWHKHPCPSRCCGHYKSASPTARWEKIISGRTYLHTCFYQIHSSLHPLNERWNYVVVGQIIEPLNALIPARPNTYTSLGRPVQLQHKRRWEVGELSNTYISSGQYSQLQDQRRQTFYSRRLHQVKDPVFMTHKFIRRLRA